MTDFKGKLRTALREFTYIVATSIHILSLSILSVYELNCKRMQAEDFQALKYT